MVVDVKAVEPLPKPVTLAAIKAEPKLKAMVLVNNTRLSVQPVTADEWKIVCKMGGLKSTVMAGLVPAIHAFHNPPQDWMPAQAGHDDGEEAMTFAGINYWAVLVAGAIGFGLRRRLVSPAGRAVEGGARLHAPSKSAPITARARRLGRSSSRSSPT